MKATKVTNIFKKKLYISIIDYEFFSIEIVLKCLKGVLSVG